MSQTCEGSKTEVCGNDDHETCSWCLACGPDDDLREMRDGARVCRECRDSHLLSFSLHDEGARGY